MRTDQGTKLERYYSGSTFKRFILGPDLLLYLVFHFVKSCMRFSVTLFLFYLNFCHGVWGGFLDIYKTFSIILTSCIACNKFSLYQLTSEYAVCWESVVLSAKGFVAIVNVYGELKIVPSPFIFTRKCLFCSENVFFLCLECFRVHCALFIRTISCDFFFFFKTWITYIYSQKYFRK